MWTFADRHPIAAVFCLFMVAVIASEVAKPFCKCDSKEKKDSHD